MLADRFVKDPREVVKPGDVVQVRVVEVDPNRKRIALTMRSDEAGAPHPAARREAPAAPSARPAPRAAAAPETGGAMAEALRRAALAKGMPKR